MNVLVTDHHENSVVSICKVIFVIVVGEVLGDILGVGLICSLWLRYLNVWFVGIGGDEMIVEGFYFFVFMEWLLVMGFVEVFG